MDHAADEEPRLQRWVRQLADSAWRRRAEAVEELLADGKVSSGAALETIQAVLSILQSAGTPWRARAAALRVLKGFDQEAHLKALAHLASHHREEVAPSEATMEHSQDIKAAPDGSDGTQTDADKDEMETDDDRVVADIPIPIHLEGNRRQDEVSSVSSFSSLGKTESEIAEDSLEAVQLPDSAEALLSAVAAYVNREEPPDCAVTDQIEIARVARVAFEGGPKMQLAAVKLLADFGGSFDLHRLLKEAVKKEDAQVRQEAAIAATKIAGRYPGKANAEATARLLGQLLDDTDALVRREAARGLGGLDMRSLHAPRLTLLCPLLRTLSDQDVATRRAAAEGVLSKAEQLLHLPQMVWHGHGQQAGVGLAAIRTASGDEVEALLLNIFQESRDWWCFRAAVTLALSLSGSVKSKAWDMLLDRLSFSSGSAVARGVCNLNDDFRCTGSVRLGIPQQAFMDRERTEDALKHLESGWWRLRMQATEVLTQAVQSGCFEAGMGVVKKLSHTSSRVRMAAVSILSQISRCLPDVLVRTTEGLLERLSDPVADVRAAASATFVRIAANGVFDDQALRALLRPLLQGPSAEERRACSQVLLSISEVEEHGPRLAMMICGIIVRALLTSDVNGSDAKNVALPLLAQITPRKHAPAMAMLTQVAKNDEDASVRLAALDALRAVAGEGSKHLKEAALHLVLDEDDVVRDAAAEILEGLDLTHEEPDELQPGDVVPILTAELAPGGHEDHGAHAEDLEPLEPLEPPSPPSPSGQNETDVVQDVTRLAQQFSSVQCLDFEGPQQMEQLLKDEALQRWLRSRPAPSLTFDL